MYVADVTSISELQYLLAEAEDFLLRDPGSEQARWDIQDITERIEEVRLNGSATP